MKILKVLLLPYMSAVVAAAFLWPEPAKGFLGESSRIVFFHVPCAWTSSLAFIVAILLVSSVAAALPVIGAMETLADSAHRGRVLGDDRASAGARANRRKPILPDRSRSRRHRCGGSRGD